MCRHASLCYCSASSHTAFILQPATLQLLPRPLALLTVQSQSHTAALVWPAHVFTDTWLRPPHPWTLPSHARNKHACHHNRMGVVAHMARPGAQAGTQDRCHPLSYSHPLQHGMLFWPQAAAGCLEGHCPMQAAARCEAEAADTVGAAGASLRTLADAGSDVAPFACEMKTTLQVKWQALSPPAVYEARSQA